MAVRWQKRLKNLLKAQLHMLKRTLTYLIIFSKSWKSTYWFLGLLFNFTDPLRCSDECPRLEESIMNRLRVANDRLSGCVGKTISLQCGSCWNVPHGNQSLYLFSVDAKSYLLAIDASPHSNNSDSSKETQFFLHHWLPNNNSPHVKMPHFGNIAIWCSCYWPSSSHWPYVKLLNVIVI